MFELLTRNWGWVLFRGLLLILFGVMAWVWPGLTAYTLVILFGAYSLIDGVFAIIMGAKGGEGRGLLIFTGILGVLIGIMVFIWPLESTLALLVLIAVWAVVIGVSYIVKGIELKGDAAGRWLLILSGAAGVALGFVLIFNPGTGVLGLTWAIGLFAIAWGVFSIIAAVRLKKLRDSAKA
ncbi:HdeD family acid-resistance protein [Salininema proteolyticum]|uniref:HdeD family acid-resistance protein n=1 Tax=Salininema proteolyticum TaxID=1607685 RepID=A0ABV8TUV2_9ACTN